MIEVSELAVRLGAERIIDGLSFQVKKGQKAVICGDSGSGKTTLLRTPLGLPCHREGQRPFR